MSIIKKIKPPLIKKIKPPFWDYHEIAIGLENRTFSFRRKWKLMVLLISVISLTPMVVKTLVDYRLTRSAMKDEMLMHLSRVVSGTRLTVSEFLDQRKSAMDFIVRDNSSTLNNDDRMAEVLENLQKSVGGFKSIGMMDANGKPLATSGTEFPKAERIGILAMFEKKTGPFYAGEVRKDPKGEYRIAIALKHHLPDESFFILLADLDAISLPRDVEIQTTQDLFIADRPVEIGAERQADSAFDGGHGLSS